MPTTRSQVKTSFLKLLFLALLSLPAFAGAPANPWWNPDWSIRKKITLDSNAAGLGTGDAPLTAVVLLRLSQSNLNFDAVRDDHSDLRFIAADGKTALPYHVESFDSVLQEAYVWVKVPDIKAGAPVVFWLYYGNSTPNALRVDESKATYDPDTVLVYHFAEKNAAPKDSTGNANNGETPATVVDGALIASGLRLTGKNSVTLPKSPSLAWNDGQALTWSAWIKPSGLAANAVIYSRKDGANSFIIGLNNGTPYVELAAGGNSQQFASTGTPLIAGTWRHLAVEATGTDIKIFVDGDGAGSFPARIPAINTQALLGRDGTPGEPEAADAQPGFTGDLDELQISKVARPPALLKLSAVLQIGGDKADKLLAVGADEASGKGGESELAKHLSLLSDISKSLTPDGWAVIFFCTVLALIGGTVAVLKVLYLNRISKATKTFLKLWEELASDLHVLDHGSEDSINTMGGKASAKTQKVLRQSPLYHLYQIGSSEIQDRVNGQEVFYGLSGRSMQAIKAMLDGGMVRETQKLNSSLVFLTIGIAGGPYLGLLGTVIGVMITFAVIAKSGSVEVASIAPGIAGALLATVAGLAVAIPSLFAYSYISTRIKDAISEMQIFIDEYVTRVAEFYAEGHGEEEATIGH
jgi:biopolymer transport protein ExbB